MEKSLIVDMEKVKKLAYMKLWSLSQLAMKAGLSTNTLFALQARRRKASPRTVYKLAAALSVTPSEIIETK